MNLADVMDQIAARADTIDGLRVDGRPVPKVSPPAAYVAYPTDYTFDATYGRGSDEMTLSLLVVVGRPNDRSTRDALAAYCDGDGPRSIKQVLESGTYTACDAVAVRTVDFDAISIAGVDYMAALFTLDIAGPGST